ncbi:hypothetical protein DFP72DRAFT_770403, partial [Ephemerocybe angulata]
VLRSWVHRGRQAEVNELLLSFLYSADDDDALTVLRQLKKPPIIISKIGARSCNTPVELRVLDDDPEISAEALIDSGAENSYVQSEFVKQNQLLPSILPFPIGVYNADGSLNANGSITHYVDIILRIRDHLEVLRMYITNLGS